MTAMRARAMREADTRKNSVRALEVSRHNRAQVSGVLDVGWTLVGRWLFHLDNGCSIDNGRSIDNGCFIWTMVVSFRQWLFN
jgi:hypothetical protein